MFFERRKDSRLVFDVGSPPTADLDAAIETVLRAYVLDISSAGARLLVQGLKKLPDTNQVVLLRITAPEGILGPFQGRIVYARSDGEGYRIGLSFFPPGTPAGRARHVELESWIADWNSKTTKPE